MAIRLELPPALFPDLNKHWQTARSYFQRQAVGLRSITLRTVNMPVVFWRGLTVRYTTRWSMHARSENRRRQDFQAFVEQYEELVDLLCWTAQEGVHAEHRALYTELRRWMCANYRKVRTPLRPYWVEPGAPEQIDPFEALFAAESIEAFINAPDSITDLMMSRTALENYQDDQEKVATLPH